MIPPSSIGDRISAPSATSSSRCEAADGRLIPTGLDAPVKLARLLQSGTHVGMLVDQHFSKGVEVTFFGRRCLANPLIALLARQTEAPIHGLRAVRKPDGNSFSVDIASRSSRRTTPTAASTSRAPCRRHGGGRRLGARASRAMALATPPLAGAVRSGV